MWDEMTRAEKAEFLREHSGELIEILLDAYDMTLEEIVINHLEDQDDN